MNKNSKWYRKMLEIHGSEEAVSAFMREAQKKSRENYKGTGGFKYLKEHDPDKLSEMSKKALDKRWGKDG